MLTGVLKWSFSLPPLSRRFATHNSGDSDDRRGRVVFQIVDGPVDAGELYVEATTSLAVRVVMEDGEDGADILEAAKPRVVMVDEVPVFPFDQIRRSDGDGTYTLLGVPFGAVQVIIDERPPDVFVKAINARGGQYGFSST
jgi:hypothetical protein